MEAQQETVTATLRPPEQFTLAAFVAYPSRLICSETNVIEKLVLDRHLQFTTRAEYIRWRAAWKHAWSNQSMIVRSARHFMAQPGGNSEAQTKRHRARILGYNLLVLRRASKQKAGEQYRLSKQT